MRINCSYIIIYKDNRTEKLYNLFSCFQTSFFIKKTMLKLYFISFDFFLSLFSLYIRIEIIFVKKCEKENIYNMDIFYT